MELNKIIIGVVLVAVVSSTFLLFISEGVSTYNPSSIPADYANSFNNISANLKEISVSTDDTEQELDQISGNSNVVSDFLGFFFGNGYQAVKTFINGMKLTNIIAEEGVKNTLGSSELGNQWKSAIFTVVIVLLVSILLHFVIKSERL